MGRYRIVEPEIARLTLSDGDWIDVKRRLNVGEQRNIQVRLTKEVRFGESSTVNPEQIGFARMIEYLVGWSLQDKQGRALPLTDATIRLLDEESYREIDDALDRHIAAMTAERTREKNCPDGENLASATSPSRSVVAGASPGFVN